MGLPTSFFSPRPMRQCGFDAQFLLLLFLAWSDKTRPKQDPPPTTKSARAHRPSGTTGRVIQLSPALADGHISEARHTAPPIPTPYWNSTWIHVPAGVQMGKRLMSPALYGFSLDTCCSISSDNPLAATAGFLALFRSRLLAMVPTWSPGTGAPRSSQPPGHAEPEARHHSTIVEVSLAARDGTRGA